MGYTKPKLLFFLQTLHRNPEFYDIYVKIAQKVMKFKSTIKYVNFRKKVLQSQGCQSGLG